MKFAKGQSGNPLGRPRSPNKATTEFRATVTALLEGNASNVDLWLSAVALGQPATDKEGNPIFLEDGTPKMLRQPDPGKALDLMAKLAEFAAPKLARVEHAGDPDAPIKTVNRIELVPLDGNGPDSPTA